MICYSRIRFYADWLPSNTKIINKQATEIQINTIRNKWISTVILLIHSYMWICVCVCVCAAPTAHKADDGQVKATRGTQTSPVLPDVALVTSSFSNISVLVSTQTGSWRVPDGFWLCWLVPDWFRWAGSSVAGLPQQPVGPHQSFSLHLNVSPNLQLEAAKFLQDLTGRFRDVDPQRCKAQTESVASQ